MYPNPANVQVTLSNSSNITLETAMIYDLNGKLVSQINLQDMQSEQVIDVSSYATGVYMVQIIGDQSSVVKRMIKE
ncbi:MAG: T9SS type A sorting domain-containing protein [Flavobacteriaceae bacterium]|nr:T9SS type A sorting domain-containing protein [Flavobacteriaceae bacterium]